MAARGDDDYEPSQQPREAEDASDYLSGMRREALGVLFPNAKELPSRIGLITKFRGRAPDIYMLYQAYGEYEGWLSIEEGRPIDWKKLDPIYFLSVYATSIQGWRSNQAVEVARATPPDRQRRSLIDLIKGM